MRKRLAERVLDAGSSRPLASELRACHHLEQIRPFGDHAP